MVLLRLVWGFAGGRYARFAQFVCSPSLTRAYALQWCLRLAPRYIGHNPLGGCMVLVLLACTAGLSLTGVLYTSEWLWSAWLSELHAALAWLRLVLVLVLVLGHWVGAVLTGRYHRENLVAAILSGSKRAASDSESVDAADRRDSLRTLASTELLAVWRPVWNTPGAVKSASSPAFGGGFAPALTAAAPGCLHGQRQ